MVNWRKLRKYKFIYFENKKKISGKIYRKSFVQIYFFECFEVLRFNIYIILYHNKKSYMSLIRLYKCYMPYKPTLTYCGNCGIVSWD